MPYKTYLTTNPTTRVTAGFPTYPSGGEHHGIDYVLSPDKTIRCVSPGIVQHAGWGTGANERFGIYVSVKMANGQIMYYAHMESKAVNTGMAVNNGDVLGIMGATGNVTGPHVHVALKSQEGAGNWINPSGYTGIPNAVGTYETVYAGDEPPPDPPPTGDENADAMVAIYAALHKLGKV